MRSSTSRFAIDLPKRAARLLAVASILLVGIASLLASVSAKSVSASGDASASDGEEAAASGRSAFVERPAVATLPPPGDHWLWVPDRLLAHSLLYDGDSGRVLGMIDSPLQLTPQPPMMSIERGELYSVDIGYSRGVRGERKDFLTIYDLETLAYEDEILFPTRAATGNTAIAYSARIGSRFVGVFNQFPATSVSILDLELRTFVEEIGVSGCSGIYPIDELRFATLCGDGTATVIELDAEGHKAAAKRSEKFFDTLGDPVFTSAGRIGTRWIFVSFGGMVHDLDFAEAMPRISPPWSIHGENGGDSSWIPGGLQLVAVHAASERLFVVVHEGGSGSHKDAGPEIWSFDLRTKDRLARILPPSLSATFLGGMLGIPSDSFTSSLLRWILPADTVHSIAVSQDEAPLLFVRNAELGAVGVIDANDGRSLRILGEAGLFGPTLAVAR